MKWWFVLALVMCVASCGGIDGAANGTDADASSVTDSSLRNADRATALADVDVPNEDRKEPSVRTDAVSTGDVANEDQNPPPDDDAFQPDGGPKVDVVDEVRPTLDASAAVDTLADVAGTECLDGQSRCRGPQPQACHAGRWVDTGTTCECGVCSEGFCVGLCLPGTRECNGRLVEECVGCQWLTRETCPFVCASGSCRGECVPGSARCDDAGARQICSVIGQWVQGAPCDGGCVGTGICGVDGGPSDEGGL